MQVIQLFSPLLSFVSVPENSAMSVEDNFSLNQSRTEDITLKEDFGRDFRNLMEFGRILWYLSACTWLFYISCDLFIVVE